MNNTAFYTKLLALPNGAYDVFYHKQRYLLRKEVLLEGKLIKIYAEALGNTNVVSGNYYTSINNGVLKPCEMSDKKVIDFILNCRII